MSKGLRQELLLLLVLLLCVMVIGNLSGYFNKLIIIFVVGYLLWNLYNIQRLTRWLRSPSKNTPETIGVWEEIYYQLYQLYQRQRNARRKLTSILSRFQESTQALPYATVVLNEYFEIDWFNSAAKRMFDLNASKDVGQRIDNLIRLPRFAVYLKAQEYEAPLEFNHDSSRLSMSLTAYGSGQYLMTVRDITERTKLDAMRRDFIANASHELKTPITVISGFIETLREQANEGMQVPLEKIQQQTSRMQLILNELLQLARLESENYIDQPEVIDLEDLLSEVHQDALVLDAGVHNIQLSSGATTIEGSREELRMAFSNLVINAIRYTPEKGKITVFSAQSDTGVSVGVKDEGIGITYEHIPRLTERFYRVDPGRSRNQGGTGLGLAIVKHVLDRHRAQLAIQSTPGKGSEFRCDFPASQTVAIKP